MLASLGSESPMTATSPDRAPSLVAAYEIPHSSRHDYANKQRLRAFLERKYRELVAGNPNASQYVSANGITPDVVEWLDKNRRNLPPARISYSETEEVIIWKLAGPRHEMAARNFGYVFNEACIRGPIGSYQLFSIGSGRFENYGRSKEPDEGYKPINTRPEENDRPTIVIEAGYSESLNQLRVDAHHWLTKTDGQTRIVLLLHVNQGAKRIRLERWEMVWRPLPRGQNTDRPAMVQEIIMSVTNTGVAVAGAPLLLPIDKLFDQRPAHIPAGDLQITGAQLQAYVSAYFASSR